MGAAHWPQSHWLLGHLDDPWLQAKKALQPEKEYTKNITRNTRRVRETAVCGSYKL